MPNSATLYISPSGNDLWSGKLAAPRKGKTDGPFATLERARDEIRKLKAAGPLPKGGVTVEIRGGIYQRSQAFELSKEDSGTEESPLVYRARKGEEVRLVGGKVVTGWKPVKDPAVVSRMDDSARGNVWQADLKAQGMTDLGKMEAGPTWGASSPGLEVFFADQPMTLARWPNEGFVNIPQVLGPTLQDIRGTKGCMEGVFSYEGDHPERWAGEKDIMLHGYWYWDWADQRLKVASIDTTQKVITLEPQPQHSFGFRNGMYYYAYNLLPELDQPGEWYLDRDTSTLYFWPPSPLEKSQVMVSVVPTLLQMNDAAHITFRGLTFECTRGTAVSLNNVTHCMVAGCVIRNTGAWAVGLSGKDSGVVGCDIYNTADGGVTMSGGDRRTLTPANLYVDNCHLYRYGRWNPICKPAVQVDGVGNRVTHNLINDGPHMAIMWGGNDHLFEYNEMHSVVHSANDAGIMYAGYNPAMRGHIIRYNYFHHVFGFQGRGCNGVYLDDMFCSATIFGNVFYKVPRAAFIGGGHDNVVDNNVFVDCRPALHVDARMMGWAAASVPIMKQRLEEVPYQEEPWRSRYPQLMTYLEGNYAEPRGNLVTRNICWGGSWDEIEGKARPGVKLENNLVSEDPRFVDPAKEDFRLKPDSPAWKLGFERIPVEKIGLYKDEFRVSWPVKTTIRPEPPREKTSVGPHPAPPFLVKKAAAPVKLDGQVSAGEWPEATMTMKEAPSRDPISGGPAVARLCHDGNTLYVAIAMPVSASSKIKRGATWGQDDGAEVCFRDLSGARPGPIVVVQGFASGASQSVDHAGAPNDLVQKVGAAIRFKARIEDKQWIGEWAIPLLSAGITYKPGVKLGFNLGALRAESDEWIVWTGALGPNWQLDNTGKIVLE
ncbi:MAG: right-handed parallel beta-helix repeat-containing protein [Armatimonadetes bacterium]|nr:right-handed parallel beta-helix repeat-containing protein [Armatimonadota bacterium]